MMIYPTRFGLGPTKQFHRTQNPFLYFICRAHPHSVEYKNSKEHRGVVTADHKVCANGTDICFENLGILCAKKDTFEMALKKRKDLRVDPFNCK